MSNEEMLALANSMTSESLEQMTIALVGDYRELKPLTLEQEAALHTIVFMDSTHEFDGKLEEHMELDKVMKECKHEVLTTMLYLYCNWRVWATYKRNEELAKKYQAICDKIDGYIFDNWDKDKIRYFVRETD